MGAHPDLDRRALEAALDLFVKAFVVDDKRAQIRARLLTAERREDTLTTLPRWLQRSVPLAGADRSHTGATKRFGELSGIHLVAAGAERIAIADALARGRAQATLFIADNGNLAVVTIADGTAASCSRF